jgi:hypothetical protein
LRGQTTDAASSVLKTGISSTGNDALWSRGRNKQDKGTLKKKKGAAKGSLK